jgi:hypothetical protein
LHHNLDNYLAKVKQKREGHAIEKTGGDALGIVGRIRDPPPATLAEVLK